MGWYQNYANNILSGQGKQRLLAVDAFRGLAIAMMILANNPGSWSYVYAPLKHAKWHGWTLTDLVFPFFIFIVGFSIHLVVHRELTSGTAKTVILKKACIRVLKLFGLGLFLGAFYYNFKNPDFNWFQHEIVNGRLMGVLQRIALVYLFTVILVMLIRSYKARIATVALILLGYWAAMALIPYSDAQGAIYKGLYEHGNSLAAWFDSIIIPVNNLYYSSTTPFVYDPEGLLSTLPAIAGCMIGVLTGQLLSLQEVKLSDRIKSLLIFGLLLFALGELWGMVFPINKALWTSSYVLLSSGLAMITLGFMLWLVDVKQIKSWTAPLVVFGANAIVFFMFSGMLARVFMMIPVGQGNVIGGLYNNVYAPIFGNYNGSLAYSLSFMLLSYIAMHQLYIRRIFIKV